MLLLWVVLPEFNKVFEDRAMAFVFYMTMQELLKAFVAVWFVRNVFGYCAGVWFLTQAIDEATNQNLWEYDTPWEYLAFAVLAISAYLFHRYHR